MQQQIYRYLAYHNVDTQYYQQQPFCSSIVVAYSELGLHTELDSSDPMADFSSKHYNIALTTIPTSKPHSKKHHSMWFNDDCKTATKDRKKVLHKVKNISHN